VEARSEQSEAREDWKENDNDLSFRTQPKQLRTEAARSALCEAARSALCDGASCCPLFWRCIIQRPFYSPSGHHFLLPRFVVPKTSWEYMPLVNRAFAYEVAKLAASPNVTWSFAVADGGAVAELSPHGHAAELIARSGGLARALAGAPAALSEGEHGDGRGPMPDCLHYKHPSVNDWLNAHLLNALADEHGA